MKELKMKSKPCVSRYLAKLIEHRNKLFRKKKKEQSNENVRMLYNKFRNKANRELKSQKKNILISILKITKMILRKPGQVLRTLSTLKLL